MQVKVLCVIVTFVLVGLSCVAGKDFKVAGFHDGASVDAVVYLLRIENDQVKDTLAVSGVRNGRYLLSGSVDRAVSCRLRVENEHRGTILDMIDFTLESGNFVAYTGSGDGSFVELNDDEERIGEAFFQNACQLLECKKTLLKEYVSADETGKDSLARVFESMIADREAEETRLVKENPESLSAACAMLTELATYMNRLKQYDYSLGNRVNGTLQELAGWDAFERRYELLGGERKEWLKNVGFDERHETVRGKMDQIRLALATSEGSLAPDMELTLKGGKTVRLHAVPGKLKIVDFWASWCGPCRASNPFLLELYGEFKDKGLEIVSVSLDVSEDAWQKAIREDKLIWKYNTRDLKGQAGSLYGISAIPCMLLLDENNRILGRNLPKDELRRVVEDKLN